MGTWHTFWPNLQDDPTPEGPAPRHVTDTTTQATTATMTPPTATNRSTTMSMTTTATGKKQNLNVEFNRERNHDIAYHEVNNTGSYTQRTTVTY